MDAAQGVNELDLVVYERIASYAFTDAICWPSQQTIADDLGVTRVRVSRAVGRLEKAGWLSIALRPRGRYGWWHNVYELLHASDEMADDAPALQAYINSRLTLFVQIEAERQLLTVGGTNELVGLVSRTGVNTYSKAAGDDNATSIARVISNTRGSSFLEPDTVIMHPTNWLSTRPLRDGTGGTVGNFYGVGPFGASYGGNVPTGLFGESIWGKASHPLQRRRRGHRDRRQLPAGRADPQQVWPCGRSHE